MFGLLAAGHRRLYACLLANFIVFGVGITLIGATVPAIIRGFSWDYWATGAVMSAGALGYLGSTFGCGVLVRRFGPRPIIVSGLAIQALGFLAFGALESALYNGVALALIGIGEGGSELVSNFTAIRLEGKGRAQLMNLLHAAFTVGAILGPLAVAGLFELGLSWQLAYRGLAVACALMAAVFAWVSFAGIGGQPQAASGRAVWALLRQPLLLLLALMILLYVGVEIGISNWLAEYFVAVYGVSVAQGAYMVSVFWGGLLVGRLALALYRGTRQERVLVGLALGATLPLLGVLAVDSLWLAVALFFAVGIGLSAVYPVVVVLVGVHFKEEQSLAIGAVAAAGGLGSLLFPLVVGGLAEGYSMTQSFWFFGLIGLIMVFVALVVWARVQSGARGAVED